MKYKTMDGNEACAHVSYMFTEVAGIYPITPSSNMAELADEYANNNVLNILNMPAKVVQMQSEAGAAGMLHGSLQSGSLSTTYTASQGLLLMIPNMYKMAGEMLPAVIHVAARSLSTHALSILGDHQDIYATRMTGFSIIACSSVQQVMDLTAISHLSAIKSSLPFLNFFDGFRTSHEIQKIEVLEKSDLEPLVDYSKIQEFKNRSLSSNNVVRGTAQDESIYFQNTEVRNKFYNEVPDIVNEYMEKINEITKREYKPFVYYGNENAKKIIIAMGSVCETIKETIDHYPEVGLIEVHLYRPFSEKYFLNVLPNSVEKIAVLDRTKEPGSNGEPLYLDVVNVLKNKNIEIYGGRYGLSSKDTNPSHIKSIYDFLDEPFNNFTVGIEDDITNLSIKINEFDYDNKNLELLIYGYGSDGMVGTSKDILKLIGDNTNYKVQGYFQYDSKKSGSLTRSHMRISEKDIKSTYYVNSPNFVVCSKESYLHSYDMLSNIKDNSKFIYVTSSNKLSIPSNVKDLIKSKNIEFYTIDAFNLALQYNLKGKISTIMEVCILKLIDIEFDKIFEKVKESIKKRFYKKGEEVVQSNLNLIEEALKYLKKVDINDVEDYLEMEDQQSNNKVFNYMMNLKGDLLKTSDFLDYKDGTYLNNTTKDEKGRIAETVPVWNSENCIQCNQCSFVCPHGVIRPYLLNKTEYEKVPNYIKEKCIDAFNTEYKFFIGVNIDKCTGCGLCAKVCPGKSNNKALNMVQIDKVEHNYVEYLSSIEEKQEQIKNTVKNSQFSKPLFEYSGACAGCGETPYLKLLTQLFKEKLVIANATGCSSIYGASMPSSPYNVPWASSLFEDNAEYSYGMYISNQTNRLRLKSIIEKNINNVNENNKDLLEKLLNNFNNYDITKEVYDNLDYKDIKEIEDLKQFILSKSFWAIGGDGWAYDIGFGGIDHVLSSNDNINILVLDTEVYSNTGGQSSKSSNRASIAKFNSVGKKNSKKDLAKIALCYPNCYVAQISLGANMQQTINAFVEAEKHDGPSIIIAYSPCISHGIKGGMGNSINQEKLAVKSGYFPIFRYNPETKTFSLDFKEPDFETFFDYLENETRFSMLKVINQENAENLFNSLKEDAIKRFDYYKKLSENN